MGCILHNFIKPHSSRTSSSDGDVLMNQNKLLHNSDRVHSFQNPSKLRFISAATWVLMLPWRLVVFSQWPQNEHFNTCISTLSAVSVVCAKPEGLCRRQE